MCDCSVRCDLLKDRDTTVNTRLRPASRERYAVTTDGQVSVKRGHMLEHLCISHAARYGVQTISRKGPSEDGNPQRLYATGSEQSGS